MHSHPAIQSSNPLFKIERHSSTVILGGGLAGLSTGSVLSEAGMPVMVFEGDRIVGGLSKTISHGEFRFDLGGHRFFTKDQKIKHFITELLSGEFLTVPRKSKIYMRSRFFDYPLRPSNALFGLGIFTSLKAVADYGLENMKNFFSSHVHVSLEDWVVSNFGRTIFDIYFKEYSEKVWGIECDRISKEWVSQRIKGLSLGVAIKNAFFKFSGRNIDTLADRFIYPYFGIGEISNRLKAKIEKGNPVMTDTKVTQIYHEDFLIKGVSIINRGRFYTIGGSEFVSSIPLTTLIKILDPPPPKEILEAASQLRYRDLMIVVIMLRRERVTDLTWVYLPERDIPMGRIHEPKNWSPYMAPQGKTHIVCEYFCFEGDEIWGLSNERLTELTITQLEKLGFTRRQEVIDSCVVRVPKAYPLFEVGYTEYYDKVLRYLRNFKNLHICGRAGMFKYYNMDHAIESGIKVAEYILKKPQIDKSRESQLVAV